MVEFLRRLTQFLGSLDAKAITSLAVSILLIVFVIFMFLFGQQWLNLDQEGQLSRLMMAASNSPWAIIGVISIFSLLALTGFPQTFLIAGTVLVFGAQNGAFYSWVATMVSATMTFGLGHFLGGRWMRRFGGERVQRTINFLSHHGVVASGLIRVVPSAPFIVVNAAAGAAHIPIWKYWTGTAIGIIPKILVIAFLGAMAPSASIFQDGIGGVVDFFTSREPLDLAIIAGILAAWIGFMVLVRWIYRRMRAQETVD